jgi:hypothetical protein
MRAVPTLVWWMLGGAGYRLICTVPQGGRCGGRGGIVTCLYLWIYSDHAHLYLTCGLIELQPMQRKSTPAQGLVKASKELIIIMYVLLF